MAKTYGAYADIGKFATLTFNGDTYKFTDQIAFSGGDADDVETTASGEDSKWKTFIQGLIDAGECTFTINLDQDQPVEMSSYQGDLVINFPKKVGQSTGAKFTCDAYLKGVGGVVAIGDRNTQALTFKLSGEPEYTAGVASGG